MIELKAAVYTRGNLSRLVREAVEAYRAEADCYPSVCVDCQAPLEPGEAEVEIGAVVFTGVPAGRCLKCGQCGIDSRVLAALEKLAPEVRDHEVSVRDLLGYQSTEKEPVAAT